MSKALYYLFALKKEVNDIFFKTSRAKYVPCIPTNNKI